MGGGVVRESRCVSECECVCVIMSLCQCVCIYVYESHCVCDRESVSVCVSVCEIGKVAMMETTSVVHSELKNKKVGVLPL